MKKFVLCMVCGLMAVFVMGCADVAQNIRGDAPSKEFLADNLAQVVEAAVPAAEGYYMVEGKLGQMGRKELFLETEQGLSLYFKLSPETIVYTGANKEILQGQAIRVVFDQGEDGGKAGKLSVIAVTTLEEEF